MSTEMRKSHSVTALAPTPTVMRKSKAVPRSRKNNGGTCLLLTAVTSLFLVYGTITMLILNRGYASRRDELDSINIFQKDHVSNLESHDLSSIFFEGLPQLIEEEKIHQRGNRMYRKPTRDWNELPELLKNDPLERVAYLRKRMPVD